MKESEPIYRTHLKPLPNTFPSEKGKTDKKRVFVLLQFVSSVPVIEVLFNSSVTVAMTPGVA
jgi:hypothetical protein